MDNITVNHADSYNRIIIKNINNYSIKIDNNTMIITRNESDQNINYITYDELIRTNLKNSKIISVLIDDQLIPNITKYNKLIIYIYRTFLLKDTIINNTLLNISQHEINDKGFTYYNDLGLSIQGTEAKKSLREIINQITKNNQRIEIKIKLKSNKELIFRS